MKKCQYGSLPLPGRHACAAVAFRRVIVVEQGSFVLCREHFGEVMGFCLKKGKG